MPNKCEFPGQQLRRIREQLGMTMRDVLEASFRVAEQNGTLGHRFILPLSRLSEIEQKGVVPSIYRVYSLASIYRLDPHEILLWYGINMYADAVLDPQCPEPETAGAGDMREWPRCQSNRPGNPGDRKRLQTGTFSYRSKDQLLVDLVASVAIARLQKRKRQ